MKDQEFHRPNSTFQCLQDEHRSKVHIAFHYEGCMFLQENSLMLWYFFNIYISSCLQPQGVEYVCLLGLLVFSKSSLFRDQTARQRPISGEVVCDLRVESEGSLKNRNVTLDRPQPMALHSLEEPINSNRVKCTHIAQAITLRKKKENRSDSVDV